MRTSIQFLACGLALLSSASGAQERRRTVSLTPRGNSEYASVTSVRTLSDGRALVSDANDRALWMLSLTGARTTAITSGAIQSGGALCALGQDSTLVFDRGSGRFVVLTPAGAVVDARADFTPPDGPRMIGVGADLYAAAPRGDLVWLTNNRADTATLMRRTAGGNAQAVASLQRQPTRRAGEGGIQMLISVPFTPVDAWVLAENGNIVIARGQPYRIDHVQADGAIHVGTPLTVSPVPVTADDRAQAAARSSKSLGSINIGGVAPSAKLPDDAYPATKAPFNRLALHAAPDGTAFVNREVATDSREALVDVFDTSGTYRDTLVLPRGAVLVAASNTVAYVTLPASGERVTLHQFSWR